MWFPMKDLYSLVVEDLSVYNTHSIIQWLGKGKMRTGSIRLGGGALEE
jgi:hypothetical protein